MPCFSSFLARIWWNFFNWCKTIKILPEKYFFPQIWSKYGIFLRKTWRAGLLKLKFFMKTKQINPRKTSQNIFFNSPALHCENAIWNIQIFASISLLFHNILQGKFEAKLKKRKWKWHFPPNFVWNKYTTGKWGLRWKSGSNL